MTARIDSAGKKEICRMEALYNKCISLLERAVEGQERQIALLRGMVQKACSIAERRAVLDLVQDTRACRISRKRQCELLGLGRSGTYYKSRSGWKDARNARILELVARFRQEDPTLGARRLEPLVSESMQTKIGRKLIGRLLRENRVSAG